MQRFIRLVIAICFWLLQAWWLGHVLQALRTLPGGTFRVYSVRNGDVLHEAIGLTFSGTQGLALAITYVVLVLFALTGLVIARRAMWVLSALVILAWACLFAGNTIQLSRWNLMAWWDWVNIAGVVLVAVHLGMSYGRRRNLARSG